MNRQRGQRLSFDEILNTAEEYRVVAPIVCADGFQISVQASNGHHCHDSSGNPESPYWTDRPPVLPFTSLELGYPSERPEPWRCTAWNEGWDRHEDHPVCDGWEVRADDPSDPTIFSYVPAPVVRALLDSHGGEVTP